MAYHRSHGLDVRIVRIFNTYGPRHAARRRAGRVELPRAGAARQAAHDLRRRHRRPAASATSTTRSAASSPCSTATITGPVNIGNPNEFTMLELAELVHRGDRLVVGDRLRAAAGRRPDAAPARHHPGPRGCSAGSRAIDLREGLERTAAWFHEHRRLTRRRRSGRAQWSRASASSRCARYQSTVRRRPSSNGTSASKPNAGGRPAGVDAAAGLTVGLGRVPADLAVEPGGVGDELDQVPDRQLLVGAEVDRLGAVVALGRQHDALGGVVDVEELAARRPGAPHLDVVVAGLDRVDALLDRAPGSRG